MGSLPGQQNCNTDLSHLTLASRQQLQKPWPDTEQNLLELYLASQKIAIAEKSLRFQIAKY